MNIGTIFKKGVSKASSIFSKGKNPKDDLSEGSFDVVDAIQNSYERDRTKQEEFGKSAGYEYLKDFSDSNEQFYYNPEKKALFLSISGTKNFNDVQTDAMLMAGKLKDTKRFQNAQDKLEKVKKLYDVETSEGVGHSLGSAVLSKLSIDKKVSVNKAVELGGKTRDGEYHIRTAGDVISIFDSLGKNTTTYHKKGYSLFEPSTWYSSHTYKNLKDEGLRIGK